MRFMRTLRIPDDGRDHPLPPGLGCFPLHRVEDHLDTVPAGWRAHGGVFLPMYQREAMWLELDAPPDDPHAVKVAAGMVNAVSGEPWDQRIRADRDQDYLVCPPQPWLDGINSGAGTVRQFVAMPLGMGYTVKGQLTGEERRGGLQIVAIAPTPATLARVRRQARRLEDLEVVCEMAAPPPGEMGLAAGGRMTQDVMPDPFGPRAWDDAVVGRVYLHIIDALSYRRITGLSAPETPVDAPLPAAHGLPWFRLYDEGRGDVAPSPILAGVRSVAEMDDGHGFTGLADDDPVHIDPASVIPIATPPSPGAVHGGRG